jgi:two-component system, NtrC family, sensor kinase
LNLRRNVILLVLTAAVLPVIIGILAVFGASPIEDTNKQDYQLARSTAWLLMRDLTGTARTFQLGTELFELPGLSKDETTGVLRMLYKQDNDVDVVVLLDSDDQAVVDPVYLQADQIVVGSETGGRLPANEADLGQFLKHLPIAECRENQRAFSGIYINKRKNVAMLTGAVAVEAGPDKKPWILAFERSLRRVQRIVSANVIGAQQTMFVVDQGGRLVAHPQGARFLNREQVDSHPIVAEFLKGQDNAELRWQDEEGNTYSGAFQQLDFLGWAVVVQRRLLPLHALGWRLPVWSWGAWACLAGLILFSVFRLESGVRRMIGEMQSLRDSAEKKAEQLKEVQASVLESGKLSAIGDLGAGVAHELNNPVGGILGLTQLMLRKKTEDDPDRRFLVRIEEEARRCKEITDNLLRFSEQQGIEHREPLRLNRVIGSTVDLLSQKLQSQRIEIERNFASDLPRILGSEGQLQRALLNVLINAETAMPDGGVLTLTTQSEGQSVVLRIKDTGRGIVEENLEHVFEPFFTTKDNWKGAGLGLSEVYQIVKEHAGEVSISSQDGKWTEVAFRFPADDKSGSGETSATVPLA